MSKSSKPDIGLMISSECKYDTEKVIVRVVMREPGTRHPCNASWRDWTDEACGREFADLELQARVSEYCGDAYLDDPEYVSVYSINLARATVMAKTLAKIKTQIAKDESNEFGDVFQSFARAVGAAWVVEPATEGARYSSYSDIEWRWRTIGQGKEMFREAIKAARARVIAKGVRHPEDIKAIA